MFKRIIIPMLLYLLLFSLFSFVGIEYLWVIKNPNLSEYFSSHSTTIDKLFIAALAGVSIVICIFIYYFMCRKIIIHSEKKIKRFSIVISFVSLLCIIYLNFLIIFQKNVFEKVLTSSISISSRIEIFNASKSIIEIHDIGFFILAFTWIYTYLYVYKMAK